MNQPIHRLTTLLVSSALLLASCGPKSNPDLTSTPQSSPDPNTPSAEPNPAPNSETAIELSFGVYSSDKPTEMIKQFRPTLDVLEVIVSEKLGKTLDIRMARHNENGLALATYLETHPKIKSVFYPGLASHPDHEVAKRVMTGFGGVVTFEIDTDLEGAMRFIDSTQIPYQAPSLGGVESLIELPVTMSFWDKSKEERARLGITDTLVRYACGIENSADIIADIEQALAKI